MKMTNIEFQERNSNKTIIFSVPKKVANAIKTIIMELAEDNENVMWSTHIKDDSN